MSRDYSKLFENMYYTLSDKLSCLVSSNLNININFDHKLHELHSSISNANLEELNHKLLSQQLSELHTMLDAKMKYIDEVNLLCCKQNKAYTDLNNEQTEAINISQHLSDVYSEGESIPCEAIQSKTTEAAFANAQLYEIKTPLILNRSESITSKKLPSSRYSDDCLQHPIVCRTADSGPLLRKKLNFKPNKHKAKKFIPFKKQTLFKSAKDGSLGKPSGNMRLSSSDSKYASFSKKHKRLSLPGGLLYGKRTRNQPSGKAGGGGWDHEDSRAYCICNKPSYGDMIACDSEKCKIEWFHYKCVDITTSPKGDWFCPMCSKLE